jgi:hypothetical protein
MRRAAKKDKNHNKITETLKQIPGVVVLDLHQLKNACDCIVGYRGKLYLMEIKNPEYLPKEYDNERLIKALTDGEKQFYDYFQKADCAPYIVCTVDEALEVIGIKNQ